MSSQFTLEELHKIEQLRRRLTSDTRLSEEQSTDYYLIKWLRARGMDVQKADEMLRKNLHWRKDNGVDTILESAQTLEKVLKFVPIAYLGDHPESGCPMFIYCMGRYDFRAYIEEIGIEKLLTYNIYIMEYVTKRIFSACSAKAGKPITQFVELVDLEHYSYRQLASSQCRGAMAKMQLMFDNNYPEMISKVFMVNTPKVFWIIYNIMKPLVAKATLDKVSIYGSTGWQKEVTKVFPAELVPKHWGGSRPGQDEFCSGDSIWTFGLDKNYFKGLDVLKVMARDKVLLQFEVLEQGSSLIWKFKSVESDISFGIFYEDREILPMRRLDSHKQIQTGELECAHVGKYTVVFDNTYSYTKGKYVHYMIEILTPCPNASIKA